MLGAVVIYTFLRSVAVLNALIFELIHIFKEDQDSHIVDLKNDSLIVGLHNQNQDSRIVDLRNQDSLCMQMFTYEDKDSLIVDINKK